MRFFLILPFLAFWLTLSQTALRADTTFYSGRTEYILVTTPKTWDLAQADAVAKGGNLVRIDNATENALVLSKVTGKVSTTAADGGGTVYVWIGGKETTTEGTYAWASDDTTFWSGGKTGAAVASLYTNWGRTTQGASGPEPDNFAGTQNRAGLALGRWPSSATTDGAAIGLAGQWNDLNGTNTLPYVIERPITKPSEGIFATFTMTHGGRPAGSFVCQLFYDKAPKTVANFISLAEGSRSWIDPKTGVSNRTYFDGLKCHRIIANFMIQGGDPLGTGSGGPGYRFVDEFVPELRHDHFGVLSMANSGVNTNGSQFFVTVSEPSTLNDVHSIFGHVVEGYETVVQPLSVVATGTADKPVEDVVIQSVTISRIGAAALAFNPLAQNLPTCEWQPARFEMDSAGKHYLKWNDPPNATYQLFSSGNLTTWASQTFDYYSGVTGGEAQSLETTLVPPGPVSQYFFRLARVVYQPLAPPTPPLKKITLTGKKRSYTTTLIFNSPTGGTQNVLWTAQSINHNSTLSNVVWTMTHFDSVEMRSDFSPAMPIFGTTVSHSDWDFKFTSATGGTFSGGLYVPDRSQYLDENGTFTVENIP